MNFHLEFNPKDLAEKIKHTDKLMLIGSCFTENIGDKLLSYKFNVLQNPNGILFNPVSVCEAVENYINHTQISVEDVFELNEAYHSWQHHSRFSAANAADVVSKINESTALAHNYLKKTDWLIITLGSAWVYYLTDKAANKKNQSVAANNHKAPADWFNRQLLDLEKLYNLLSKTIQQLRNFNPSIKIIFTISPVRHLREGFVENNRSKSLLNIAVHKATEIFNSCYYFPAFELVIDDLRDHRFFAEDLVHPNYAATNYVWEKFVNTCIDNSSQKLMERINEINAAYSHKPFNTLSNAHQKFKATYLDKINSILQDYPYVQMDAEKAYFS